MRRGRRFDFGDPCALRVAVRQLEAGNVAVLPTETLYGFSVPAASEAGLRRVMQLKRISHRRAFVALVHDVDALEPHLVADSERVFELLRRVWPAPLTAVVRVRSPLAWGKRLESGWSAAFRVPAHPRLRLLLVRLARPLLSTSVNRTGESPFVTLDAIGRVYAREPDVWMFRDRGLENVGTGAGSTVADFTVWPPRVLRPGRFDLERVLGAA